MEKLLLNIKKHRVFYVLTLLFLSIMIVHFVYNARGIYADDGNYFQYYPLMYDSLFDYLKVRYNSWSSRVSIEVVMFTLINKRILFSVINSLVYVLLAYSFYLFFDKKSIIISLIAVCVLPFYHFTSVGLYTGSVHYTWPIAFLMYSLVYVKKIIGNQKLNVCELVLLFFCISFIMFVEICAVLLLVFMIASFIYNYVKNRKISLVLLVSAIILVCGLIFMLTAPGNANRSILEFKYFPEYRNFNILQKFAFGLVFVANANSLMPNAINIIFSLSLLAVALKNKNKLATVSSIIPLAMQLIFYLVYIIIGIINKNLNFEFLRFANGLSFNNCLIYILCFHATIVTISNLVTLFVLFTKKDRIFYILSYLLVVGLIGSFCLNASISFYADYRPTIYSGFVLLIMIQSMLYLIIDKKKLNK